MTGGLARIAGLLALAGGAIWIVMHPDLIDAGAIESSLRSFGIWAPAGFVLLYAAGTVLFFSGALLSLAGGALFGPVWGTLWNLLGATLGATLAFLIARGLGADWPPPTTPPRHTRCRAESPPHPGTLAVSPPPSPPVSAVSAVSRLPPVSRLSRLDGWRNMTRQRT